MNKRLPVKKTTLAYLGAILVWLPIVFTLVTGVVASLSSRKFLMDYLMPAELFPLELVGAALLWWAARRAGRYGKPLALSALLMTLTLVASQLVATWTGLASGRIAAAGWPWVVVVALFALFGAGLVAQCVLSLLLLRHLGRNNTKQDSSSDHEQPVNS